MKHLSKKLKSTENAKIVCPAKPITHAFICFKDNDERNKYVISANSVEERIEWEEDKDITISGRRRKISSQKIGENQMLHSHMTQHSSQFDFSELDLKLRVG